MHYFRGEYERVVELATDNLAALPADWAYEDFGNAAPASVYIRYWLVMSLTHLGRFAEAAEHQAEAMRLGESSASCVPHRPGLPRCGHDPPPHGRLGEGTLTDRAGDGGGSRRERRPPASWAVTSSAWALAQLGEASEALNRLQEGEQLLERQAARGLVDHRGGDHHSLGRACLLLGRLDEARSLADRAVESCPGHPGFAAYALHLLGDIATHPDRFDAERGEAHYRKALALAEPRGMRPLVAHCHLGLGKLYRRTDKREQAREHLTTAAAMYRERGMAYWLETAEAEMKELA